METFKNDAENREILTLQNTNFGILDSNSTYVDCFRMYLGYYNKIPNFRSLNFIDIDSFKNWFEIKYKNQIINQHYKQRFDEECNKRLGDFLVNGFEVHRSHVINNLAAYIYTESKKQKPRVAVFDTSPTSQINNWLIVFSILNNDCFFMHCLSPESTCTRYGYPWENYQKRHSELTPVRLPIEQVEIFEKIFGLSGLDKYAIEQAIDNFTSKSWDGDQFSYYKFKQWFLENIKI